MTDSPLDHETFCKVMAAQRGAESYRCAHGHFWSAEDSLVQFTDCTFASAWYMTQGHGWRLEGFKEVTYS